MRTTTEYVYLLAFSILIHLILSLPAVSQAEVPTPRPTPAFMVAGPIGAWAPPARTNIVRMGPGPLPGSTFPTLFHYSVDYWNRSGEPRNINVGVEEVLNVHWIVHEIELELRKMKELEDARTPQDKLRVPPYHYELRSINGQRVFFVSSGGYIWTTRENLIVNIDWGREVPTSGKYEAGVTFEVYELPQEFLNIYLARLPSNLPNITFDSTHEQQFVRDEFDRDLEDAATFLGRWQQEGESGGPHYYMHARGALDSIRDRRSRYFGGQTATQWDRDFAKRSLRDPRLDDMMTRYSFWKSQYDELKAWWDQHRNDTIDLSRGKGDLDRDGRIGEH